MTQESTTPPVEENSEQPAEQPAPEAQELHLMLEDARNKADEHWNQLLRVQAEMENLRRRAERDVESAHKYALEKFAVALLPVKDSLEMGKPLRAGDTVSINLTVSLRKENSFELSYEWINKSGELAAKARTVHVFVDKNRWVKIPIYADIEKGLESHQRDVNL